MRTSRSLLLAFLILTIPVALFAQFGVSITIAPPELPVYTQPMVPADGYLWTPGYWGYGDEGYFWVPGTWVQAPEAGLLWTPGYWGWGVRRSVSTAASTTGSATGVWVIKADIGGTEPLRP